MSQIVKNLELDKIINQTSDLIVIEKQEDGNWIGKMNKLGKVVLSREIGPETVLQKLLTHDANQ